jgi:hypothetical protein
MAVAGCCQSCCQARSELPTPGDTPGVPLRQEVQFSLLAPGYREGFTNRRTGLWLKRSRRYE